jgi:hypothetical protein
MFTNFELVLNQILNLFCKGFQLFTEKEKEKALKNKKGPRGTSSA